MSSFVMQVPFKNKTLKVLVHGKHNFVVIIDNKAKMSVRKLKGSWKIICSNRCRKRMAEIMGSDGNEWTIQFITSYTQINEELIISILTKEYENHRIEKVIFG